MAQVRTVVCPVTGELLENAVILEEGDSYRTKEQDEGFAKKQTAARGRGVEFTFSNMDAMPEVIESISDKHCGYLLFLQCFVNYAAILENPNQTAMTKDDMMRTLRLKRTTFTSFLNDMVVHEIIYVDEANGNVRYRLNPRYHFQGKSRNQNVIKTFTAKVKELYSEVTAKDLGFIYKLLPYVHMETNTICANPYERDVNFTIALTKADISVITGVDEKTVYRKLRKLKFGDQYVFAEVIRGKERFYKINPFVFYRNDGRPDATLREMFSIHANFRK